MSIRKLLQPIVALILIAMFSAQAGMAGALQLFSKARSVTKETARDLVVRQRPKTGSDDQIEQLAREIDWLEAYLERYGSVVAKHPDVWGESRLTKFRNEYEQEMARRLSCFKPRDNASISRSDMAFLASATGLGAAIQGRPEPSVSMSASSAAPVSSTSGEDAEPAPASSTPATTAPAVTAPTINQQIEWAGPKSDSFGFSAANNLEPTTELDQLSRYINHLHSLRRINEGDDTSDSPGYSLNLVRIPVSINPGRDTRRGHGAEVTITATPHLSNTLLPETFRSLVINDVVDQLALPILKLAEDENLEFTRAVQLFDLKHRSTVDALQEVALRVRSDDPACIMIEPILNEVFQGETTANSYLRLRTLVYDAVTALKIQLKSPEEAVRDKAKFDLDKIASTMISIELKLWKELGEDPSFDRLVSSFYQDRLLVHDPMQVGVGNDLLAGNPSVPLPDRTMMRMLKNQSWFRGNLDSMNDKPMSFQELTQFKYVHENELRIQAGKEVQRIPELFSALAAIYFDHARISINPVTRRRSSLPIPQVMLEEVIGRIELVEMALEFKESYNGRYVAWNGDPALPAVHLADVRHYLQSNLRGAHDLLTLPQNRELLQTLIEPGLTPEGLASAVRAADEQSIRAARDHLVTRLQPGAQTTSIMVRLAWPVVVEMALLNDQLNRDVHDIAVTRGDCGCHPSQRHTYYLPMPVDHAAEQGDAEFLAATEAFQDYVRCRWPILVFHVDPVNEEQNVQESSVLARELAIAASIGLASGRMNFQQANRFSRAYQEQIEAISLNRTISGFSHSNDTFGWRFRPRVQTHKGQSTVRAFGETVFGRGPDANLREAAIEPGMRECTAIVLMPSFVPYCDFDVRTNWFRLDNPRAADLSMHQSMQLSRSIKAMQESSVQCSNCAHLYRDGETDRLLRRVDQLDRELPLQSMRVQIPYENTLGGFEMFSNGVTDLSPELVGWYGGPGIKINGQSCCTENCGSGGTGQSSDSGEPCGCKSLANEVYGKGTTVFVVGDNFSVHETRIIAGGVEIPREHVKLISRQVMQVTIPGCVETVVFDKTRYVAVHAATPYGVTSHLHIPAMVTAALATVEEAVVKLTERVEKLEFVTQSITWEWAGKPELALAHSWTPRPGGGNTLSCIQPANQSSDVTFAISHAGSRPDVSPVPPGLKVVGQLFLGDKPLGEAFWIAGTVDPGKWKFSTSAEKLRDSLLPVLSGVSMDDIGNNETTELKLGAHVVFTNGGNPPQLLCEPREVLSPFPVRLVRRINPPGNQQCKDKAAETDKGKSEKSAEAGHDEANQPAPASPAKATPPEQEEIQIEGGIGFRQLPPTSDGDSRATFRAVSGPSGYGN